MTEKREEEKRALRPKKLTFYDPANSSYERRHLCVLLGELDREAEGNGKGDEELKTRSEKEGSQA